MSHRFYPPHDILEEMQEELVLCGKQQHISRKFTNKILIFKQKARTYFSNQNLFVYL